MMGVVGISMMGVVGISMMGVVGSCQYDGGSWKLSG